MAKDQTGYSKDQALAEIGVFTLIPQIIGYGTMAVLVNLDLASILNILFWTTAGLFVIAGWINFFLCWRKFLTGKSQRLAAAATAPEATSGENYPPPPANPEQQA